MKKVFVSAIIAAAGGGVRMGGVCKPLLRLGNTSVFERVLKVFTDSALIDEVICVCGGDERFEDIVSRPWNGKPVRIVQGGSERHISVYNGIAATDPSCSVVCIHDCARPFVTEKLIELAVNTAAKKGAACISSPVTDTIKFNAGENCIKTPERSRLFAVQTPQAFIKDVYLASYAAAAKARGPAPTDETTMAEKAGFKVEYIMYEGLNMKLTTPSDHRLAEAYVRLCDES